MSSHTNWNKAPFRVLLARIRQVVMILVFVASLVGMNPIPARADSGWTAYNDCVYDSGTNTYIGTNVTTFGVGNSFTGSTSGELLDQATGTPTGVTATLTQSGGVNWQPATDGGGADTAASTDAYNTFYGIANMTGVIYYGSSGWYVDLSFTGLDPEKVYTFATSASRGNSSYTNRKTIYTLSGADTYTNASTVGVDVLAQNSVRFNTGDNFNEGFVARWTGITATDGTFAVRAEADPSSESGYKAYAFDVFMLQEESSSPAGPTISITGTPLTAFSSEPGSASVEQSYTVAGSDLTDDITITAPTDFEISTTSGSGFGSSLTLTQSGGVVTATTVYVRFNRATEGTSSGDITHTSAGATQQDVAVSGTAALPPVQTLPINPGSTWKYLDNGSDQGTAWKEIAFNDSAWASGPAELGYGDGGEATVVYCGPSTDCKSSNYITTYFRYAFNVSDKSIYSGLDLGVQRDDGAVVYLNGTEIWRTNMPGGAVTYTTPASVAIGGADETTFYSPPSILPNTLVNGTNVLAVEIHQSGATSSDVSFDLELTGVATPTCYALTLGHTGNGTTPTAFPTNSTGCAAGQYVSGEAITLSGATPDSGWQIDSWYGTSSSSSNTLSIPASAHSAGVNYEESGPSTMVCESFNSYTPGNNIGDYTGWFDGGSGPVVTSSNGVASSIGLAPASSIFTWTSHPFDWNDADFQGINVQADFKTDASGHFDDDRIGWMTSNSSTDSSNIFGVQLDPGGSGYNIEGYWDGVGSADRVPSIVSLPTLTGNTWYRFLFEVTKLTATSASIDVTLTELDASGSPLSVVASGSIADTSALGADEPNSKYFTPANIYPAFKNYTAAAAPADNTCYEVVTSSSTNQAPNQPVLVQPVDDATDVSTSPTLQVTVIDPDSDPMDVTFYGREAGAGTGEDFTVIVLPDTQNYSTSYPATFTAQTQWIVDHEDDMNIVYVAHEGDLVNNAGSTTEWDRADASMNLLDAANIPYGVVPGNHDEGSNYNLYFGVDRFCTSYPAGCKSFYGESYPAGDNQSSYTLFSASGMDFIVVNLDYTSPATGLLDWADGVLTANADRRAIVVSHNIIDTSANFSSWGTQVYNALSDHSNLFLMLNGHYHGEARRTNGSIYSLLADYQDYPNGGNGYLRILEFSPANDEIRVKTYSPTLDSYETDAASYPGNSSKVREWTAAVHIIR